MIEEDMKMHHTSYTARDIMKMVWHRYNVSIKYWKVWHARGLALENVHGNYEASYIKVPTLYMQIEACNPRSLVKWEACPDTHKFKYLCVSFKVSLEGWKRGCRPIIGLDGCFLKGKYSGVLLTAISMDANNGMFPLAIFICKKEDGENWDTFLELVAPELRKHPLPLTVISDRAISLTNAADKHFSGCNQRSCFRHIFKNMCKYWRGLHIKNLAWASASALKEVDFNRCMDELESAASGTKQYLMNIGPKLWARSYFDKICKSDHLTNNFTESFNSFILTTRDKPICSMVIAISFLMMKIMYDRKRDSSNWDENGLVPRVQKILSAYKEKENDYITELSGDGTYCVRKFTGEHWTLNITKQECGCGEWQITGIPCIHAVHFLSHSRLSFLQYCNPYLTVKAYRSTYEENIKPIVHENDWSQGNEVVLPPIITRQAGRPKHNRIKGHDEKDNDNSEKRNQKRCNKCGGFGHNIRTCQGGPIRGSSARGGGGVRSGSARGGRGIRGSSARGGSAIGGGGVRGGSARGGGVRGGRRTNENATQMPMQRNVLTIPLPPPPPPNVVVANLKAPSKKRKFFQPPSIPYFP